MQKTRSGISAGAMGALIYFSALLGGYIPLFLISGFVFLKEKSPFLKKTAFKAIVLMLVFSGMGAIIDMLNEILGIFSNLFSWELDIPLNIDTVLKYFISISKTVLFSVLGFMAAGQKDIPFQNIDNSICCDSDSFADSEK